MTTAVILTIPRVAPLRPAAAPAIIKSILNGLNVSNRILDINLDYWDSFRQSVDAETFALIDDFLFVKNKTLEGHSKTVFENYLDAWIDKILNHEPEKLFISIFSWQAQKFTEELLRRLRCGRSRRKCPLSVQRSAAAETDGKYERGEGGRERGEDRRRGRVGNASEAGTHPSRRTPGS